MITPDLITRSNRRTLALSILKDGQIVIKAPMKLSNESIQHFVYEKQDWIREKLAIIESNRMKYDDVISYKKILLFGNEYSIKLCNCKKIETSQSDMTLYVPVSIEQDKVIPKIKTWLKKQAKSILEERLEYICSKIKLAPSGVRISDSKGRWGACNSRGVVSFNFRVIMLEPAVIDYVIVHELCHLVEMNHSKRFWNLVTSFLPTASSAKNKIKDFGFLLGLY